MNAIVIQNPETTRKHSRSRMLFCVLLILASLPFLAATVSLTIDFIDKPAGRIMQARMLQSMLFNFGFWMGLCGASLALASTSEQRKTLSAAATLFGLANIVLGFALKRVFEGAMVQVVNLTPLVLPLALWFLAILMAVKAPGRRETETLSETNKTTEAQQ